MPTNCARFIENGSVVFTLILIQRDKQIKDTNYVLYKNVYAYPIYKHEFIPQLKYSITKEK